MKKFWNLMLAALVIFGAVACTENQEENIPQAEQKAVLSFVANIANDETRVDVQETDGVWTTVLEENETLILYCYDKEYEFTNADSDDKNVFTCYDDDVLKCVGKPVQIDNGYLDSKAGTKGSWIQADIDSFDPTAVITLVAQTSFFKFTSVHKVTLSASDKIFEVEGVGSVNSVDFAAGEDIMVAFLPPVGEEVTFSYSINGVKCKEIKKEFEAKKVYNLGTFTTEVADFGIVGAHQGWNTENKDAMYLIPGSNTYVRYGVKLAAGGFKIYGETSKTVTIEHPEVTGGETGYLFLKPNSNWTQANARFAAYFFGNGEEWQSMTDSNNDGIYAVQEPSKTYPKVIFCRMNPSATENKWENRWNQTGDLVIPDNGDNMFTVPSGSWDGSTTSWSKHTPVEHQDAWTEVTEEITAYWFGMNTGNDISNWVEGWSNNPGNDDIKVDTTKTYDIYFSRDADQDWGFVYYFTVKESGSEAPELK